MLVYCHYAALCRVPCPDAAVRAGHGSINGSAPSETSTSAPTAPTDAKQLAPAPAAVATTEASAPASGAAPVLWLSNHVNEDLLVAFSTDNMHLFARKIRNLSCSCATAAKGASKLLASGFHCPHLSDYDDFWQFATIPFGAMTHVFMTYRTTTTSRSSSAHASTGVAARTKDLLLQFRDEQLLWLEFEHNLARGLFLEALTTAAAAVPTASGQHALPLDVDYIDLNDHGELASTIDLSVFPPIPFLVSVVPSAPSVATSSSPMAMLQSLLLPAAGTDDEQDARFQFLRDALRNVMYDKIKLALQVSQETTGSSRDDPHCHWFLATAMETAQALDEPDLYAFTWLASGFINLQQHEQPVPGSTPPTKTKELAYSQVMHSLEICQENSLPYLTFLALQCASDVHLVREQSALAMQCLKEAVRVMPEDVDTALKMELHRKIHDLRDFIEQTTPVAAAATASLPPGRQASRSMSFLSPPKMTSMPATVPVASPTASDTLSASARLLAALTKERVTVKKSKSAFNLWAHSFGAHAPKSSADSVRGLASPRKYLLTKVSKHATHGTLNRGATVRMRSGSLLIDVLDRSGVKLTRLRVFFEGHQTFRWLQDHVTKRYRTYCSGAAASSIGDAERIEVERFYDPAEHQIMAWETKIGAFVEKDQQVLHARIAVVAAPSPKGGASPTKRTIAMLSSPSAMVTCSLCHTKIRVEDVESHSETCF
ncbi:TPA: hypothetical protein N0F65_007031 [Lagenidium giganteum]|uniref:Uncharacterized protein n=1 Tax=Lagenidium giganteum TaxID=4803 RepID=A0AAV2YZG3_9STRA|nr:TPA: hypothetical protein N0F65_007031 [Lagenidium giganteum]